jgi:hypothetical protein
MKKLKRFTLFELKKFFSDFWKFKALIKTQKKSRNKISLFLNIKLFRIVLKLNLKNSK